MKTWQNQYDSAWAPFSAANPGDEGKEENCCTGRGATRLNLKGQTATMTGSVRMPLMKGERMQHLLTYRAWHVLWWHTV